MSKQELTNAGINDDEIMLPDGWTEGADFFNPDSWGGTSNVDGQETPEQDNGADNGTNAGETAPEPVPTTDGQEAEPTGDVPPDGGDAGESAPDAAAAETTETPVQRILNLKVNHSNETVDVGAMSDEELTAVFQKARAFDESKKRAAYQSAYDKAMTETGDALTATMWAERESGYRMPDETREESTERSAEQTPGTDALKAAEERAKAAETRIKELEKTNRILKQNQAAAAKAPVRGVTGGGTAKSGNSMTDIMLKAFQDDTW